ncbi:hypothetical protein D9M68_601580 [compost metagenome]
MHRLQQRRAGSGFAAVRQVGFEGGQIVAGRQRAVELLPRLQQQVAQALQQVLGIEWLGQVGRGRQRQGGAHAGGIDAIGDQEEGNRRVATLAAHLAQQLQPADARQAVVDYQQVGPAFAAALQHAFAVLQQLQLGVAAGAAYQLGQQFGGPAISIGNQHPGCLFKFSHAWPRYSCSAENSRQLLHEPYTTGHQGSLVNAEAISHFGADRSHRRIQGRAV